VSLPPPGDSPEVEVRKDITYADGPEADAPKHKLDLYIPKGKAPAPVFFFVHGGAWRYGDRSQYPPLGNRYAKAGFLTVVPSYPTLTAHMYPFTPIELHEGYVIGRERIITRRSGLFGWDDSSRHEVHVYDDSGREVPGYPAAQQIRDGANLTELRLAEDWSAVIVRGPGQ
jgi:hypothetical protein